MDFEHSTTINNYKTLLEVLSVKVGGVVLLLGAMHFLNVYILFKLRRKAVTPARPAIANGEHPHFGEMLKELDEIEIEKA